MAHHHHLAAAAIHVALSSVSVFVVAKVLPGIKVKSFGAAVGFAIVVAVLNVVAWHLLAQTGVPLGRWLQRGIGGFVLNGILFTVAARIVGGVKVSGCIMAAIAALCVTFLNQVLRGAIDSWIG
jgi:putative membrane protein